MTAAVAPPVLDPRDAVFDTTALRTDLRRRSVRGGTITVASQAAKFALRLGGTAVLARLLSPADFGLVAMVGVVTSFAETFKDAGLSMATVQRERISHAQVSNLFWTNVGLSLLLALAVAGAAPLVAWFYGEPRLTAITLALAGASLLSGLGVQHRALLQRRMLFTRLAAIEVGSMAAGVAAAVLVAWRGGGYWALVTLTLVTAGAGATLAACLSGWRPGLPRRGSGAMPMLRFGGSLIGFNLINYLSRNGDNLLLGRFVGPAGLGLYTKAYGLMLLPLQQVNAPIAAVTVPTLARLQDEPAAFERFYCRAVRLIAYLTMPTVVVLAVLAREVVALVLGPGWEQAAAIFAVLALFGVVQPVSVTAGWVPTAVGRPGRLLRWSLVGTPVLLGGFVAGLPWGPLGVAVGAVSAAFVLVGPRMAYAYHGSPVRLRRVLAAAGLPLLLAAGLAATLLLVYHALAEATAAARSLAVLLTAGGLVGGWFTLLPGPRAEAVGLYDTFVGKGKAK